MGSVPIHMPKLVFISALVEAMAVIASIAVSNKTDDSWPWIFLIAGFLYFVIMYGKYRNKGARHRHETETKTNVTNLRKVDEFVKHKKRLSNSTMENANNKKVSGMPGNKDFINNLVEQTKEKLEDEIKR